MEQKDYYKILGIEKNADPQQIKEAYRNLAFKYHPDRNRSSDNAEKMKAINEAYAVLSDTVKRKEYDGLRQEFDSSSAYSRFRGTYSQQDIFNGSDIHQVFEEMAKSFGVRGASQVFGEFYGPVYRTFRFGGPGFSGKGFVFLGIMGTIGQFLVPMALNKLYKTLSENSGKMHIAQRGTDIRDSIYIDEKHARRGGPYAYLNRQNSGKIIVKIPPGIRDGQKIRLAGMGEKGKSGGSSGDLFLTVRIRRPLLNRVKILSNVKKWINSKKNQNIS
jgi:DnaJ-class molecular chaperone